MNDVTTSKIAGAFYGWNGGAVFKLANGQVWQQRRHKYQYHYIYQPTARVSQAGSGYLIAVEGMADSVEVVRVRIVEEGTIVSDFKGFSGDAKFQFQGSTTWIPAEYKYNYHYAYRPHAMVIDGVNGCELFVEGMQDTVRVRRG